MKLITTMIDQPCHSAGSGCCRERDGGHHSIERVQVLGALKGYGMECYGPYLVVGRRLIGHRRRVLGCRVIGRGRVRVVVVILVV